MMANDFDFIAFQKRYWQSNAEEKAVLQARYPDDLSWSEILRLYHLTIMEILDTDEGQDAFMAREGANISQMVDEKCGELFDLLISEPSPYRLRPCAVWQITDSNDKTREPSQVGLMSNASLTHLGSIEIIRIDVNGNPLKVEFVPFDDFYIMAFGSFALHRGARVLFEDGTDEVVVVPLIYGISWYTGQEHDTNGQLTRFFGHLNRRNLLFGIGVGHQDFQIRHEDSIRLFGLGSVQQINVMLEKHDPRFNEKARRRGFDPDEIRPQMGGEDS